MVQLQNNRRRLANNVRERCIEVPTLVSSRGGGTQISLHVLIPSEDNVYNHIAYI